MAHRYAVTGGDVDPIAYDSPLRRDDLDVPFFMWPQNFIIPFYEFYKNELLLYNSCNIGNRRIKRVQFGSKVKMPKAVSYKFFVPIIAAVVGLAIFSLQETYKKEAFVNANNLRKITIAQYGDIFLYAPIYIAKDAGFFTNRGLDVSFVSTGGDEKTWAAVLSGSADFGVADPLFVAVSAERGRPGVVIANIVNGVPFWGVTFNENVPEISEPTKLKGYVVATFPSPSTAFALQKKMFIEAGLAPAIREVAFGGLLPAVKTGQADIALELEPNVSTAVAQGAHIVYGLDKVYGDFAITGLTATPEKVKSDQQLVGNVVCGISDALVFIAAHPDDAARLMSKRFPEVTESVARSAIERMITSHIVPPSILSGEPAWNKSSRLRVEAGDLKQPADYKKYVDNSFADQCK